MSLFDLHGARGPWPAPAKLNLFLHVTGRRDDGYHELQTLFQFLDHADRLWFEPADDGHFERLGGLDIPQEQDLVIRAARLLARHSRCRSGVRVRVEKHLPAGGGLGGGSSDAATTLIALNFLWGLQLDIDTLAALGLQLGADVPVFVRGQAAWAEGVGDRLTPVKTLVEPWYIVVNPAVNISTAEIFSDAQLTPNAPRLRIPAFVSGELTNQLEPVVTRRYPQVARALEWLDEFQPARLTGSGACVFAASPDRQQAEERLRQLPAAWTGFVARGCNVSPLMEKLARLQEA